MEGDGQVLSVKAGEVVDLASFNTIILAVKDNYETLAQIVGNNAEAFTIGGVIAAIGTGVSIGIYKYLSRYRGYRAGSGEEQGLFERRREEIRIKNMIKSKLEKGHRFIKRSHILEAERLLKDEGDFGAIFHPRVPSRQELVWLPAVPYDDLGWFPSNEPPAEAWDRQEWVKQAAAPAHIEIRPKSEILRDLTHY